MRHPTIVIPALAHLTEQQLKKLDLVSSLFPDIPRETLLEQLILQSPEQGIHSNLREIRDLIRTATGYPNRIPLLDEVPTEISSFSQSFEAIIQGLNDDQLSVGDFETHLEDFKTHLEADPRVKQILEEFMSQTKYPDAQELFEQLRAENPELVNEVEEYRAVIEALEDVFNPPQSDAAIDAAGTTEALETQDPEAIRAIVQNAATRMFEEVQSDAAIDATGTTEALETQDPEVIGALEVSNIVPTASAFAVVSILVRIILRNLKRLKDFYKKVGQYRDEVDSSNRRYENREISQETYELEVKECIGKLYKLFSKPVSTSLDTVYPNWTSKVLGIQEEYLPSESNLRSANPEPSGREFAQALIKHIADGDLYFAAAVDYIAPSMTESHLDSFLTEIRNSEVPGDNVNPSEASRAEWFVQFDNTDHSNLSLSDSEALATKLIEIENRLSPSQLDQLDEVKELYRNDPASADVAWKDKALGWLSTLNKDLHTDIQGAYEIVNLPTQEKTNPSPQSEGSDKSGDSPQIPVDRGAPRPEVQSSPPLNDGGVPAGTESLSLQERLVYTLLDIKELDGVTEPLSPQEQIVAALYNIYEDGSSIEQISPYGKKFALEPPDPTIGVPPDPSET